jgi:hypothetical protein
MHLLHEATEILDALVERRQPFRHLLRHAGRVDGFRG